MPDGVVSMFVDSGFRGDHRHFFAPNPDFTSTGVGFNDVMSSLVIEGWTVAKPWVTLCSDVEWGRPYSKLLGTGAYPYVGDSGLPNDDVSSFNMGAALQEAADIIHGDESFGHIILFEHEAFHGRHRHVYTAEPDLSQGSSDGFAAITSSFWIDRGAWALSTDTGFGQFAPAWDTSGYFEQPVSSQNVKAPPFFTPGAYSWVEDVGVPNDALMSVHQPLPDVYAWYFDYYASDGVITQQVLWFVVVTGAHQPKAVQISIDWTVGGQFAFYSDQGPAPGTTDPNFRAIPYEDSSGNAVAWAYVMQPFSAGEFGEFPPFGAAVNVTTLTDGAFGATPQSASDVWAPPPAPATPPPQMTRVPGVMGQRLDAAEQAIIAARLSPQTSPFNQPIESQYWVTDQTPTAGTSVAVNSDVYLTTVEGQPYAGVSVVHLYNENTDGESYDIWMSVGGRAAQPLPGTADSSYDAATGVATESDPYDVTPADNEACDIYAVTSGGDPADASTVVLTLYGVVGDPNGPAYPPVVFG